jgi:hypothetical protein
MSEKNVTFHNQNVSLDVNRETWDLGKRERLSGIIILLFCCIHNNQNVSLAVE